MKDFRKLLEEIESLEEAVSSSTLRKDLEGMIKKLKDMEVKADKKKITFKDKTDSEDFYSNIYDARNYIEQALVLIDRD